MERLPLLLAAAAAAAAAATVAVPRGGARASPATLEGAPAPTNLRPVVGVLWQSVASDSLWPASYGESYLPASYVKWLETGGARVVPVSTNATEEELTAVFGTLNGLLLPGGDYDLPGTQYQKASAFLYDLVLRANDAGDYFPLWGTCQGFEQLAMITSRNDSILSQYSAELLGLPLNFTGAAPGSRLWGSLSPAAYRTLASQPATANLHQQGLSPASYEASAELSSFYDVLSTNVGRRGRTFVSSIEAREYPVYGTQFHPERNAAEWQEQEPIDHSPEAVAAMQEVANFFVTEARRNHHKFPSAAAENAALIYSFPGPRHTSDVNPAYVQTYFV